MAKKRKKKKVGGICGYAGKKLAKKNTTKSGKSTAGRTLANCRWRSPGAKKKQSARMKALNRAKKLRSKMKR